MEKQTTVRLPLRERNKQRVIQRILDAAFELFRAAGYDQTTMDAVADKAEVSRGTLFNYFPTKGALLIPFMKELYLENVQPKVTVYLETQPSTLQALHFLFTNIYEHVFQFPDMGQAFRSLQQKLFNAHYPDNDINEGSGFIDNIAAILQHGQQHGDVRVDIPLERLTRYVSILYISQVCELLERTASPEYMREMDTLLVFIGSALH